MDGAKHAEAPAALGTHLIIDLGGGVGLDDPDRIEAALRRAVSAANATLLGIHLHRFAPQGVTGVAMLAESHITVHTWPELGFAAFDAFMCGDADPWQVVNILSEAFETKDVKVRALDRGTAP